MFFDDPGSRDANLTPTRRVSTPLHVDLPVQAVLDADLEVIGELGRGAQGRVFLTRQRSLGDRPVVVKVTARCGREHLSLALLLHTHIVPLYWVHDDPERDQRSLCMPYLGCLTLEGLLVRLGHTPAAARTGRDILKALDQAHAAAPLPPPDQGPGRRFLEQASYVQAICWFGVCMAEALHYAHQRGLVHLDLKPANVLIAGEGQPVLLDFHLARAPLAAGEIAPRGLGGTPLYMAPEQRRALEAAFVQETLPLAVDGRADLYALGLILHEALGGAVPLARNLPPPALPAVNPCVSPGLNAIVACCLERDPSKRYSDAAALADDLRRHLSDRRLRGAPDRSWRERWRKWRRRRPYALASLALVLVLLAGAVFAVFAERRGRRREREMRLERIEVAWEASQKELHARRFPAAIAALEEARELAAHAEVDAWDGRIAEALAAARKGQLIDQLHDLADKVRFAAGALYPSPAWTELEPALRKLWTARTKILALSDAAELPRVRADLLDIALISIAFGAGPTAPASAHAEALVLLAEAERLCGSNATLWECRRVHAEALGDRPAALRATQALTITPPQTAWEHYTLGRDLLQRGHLDEAAVHLDRAVALRPADFWANFYQGVCAYQRGQDEDAVHAFRAAIVADPRRAVPYLNRGLAHLRLGDDIKARADFQRACSLDAGIGPFLTKRGIDP